MACWPRATMVFSVCGCSGGASITFASVERAEGVVVVVADGNVYALRTDRHTCPLAIAAPWEGEGMLLLLQGPLQMGIENGGGEVRPPGAHVDGHASAGRRHPPPLQVQAPTPGSLFWGRSALLDHLHSLPMVPHGPPSTTIFHLITRAQGCYTRVRCKKTTAVLPAVRARRRLPTPFPRHAITLLHRSVVVDVDSVRRGATGAVGRVWLTRESGGYALGARCRGKGGAGVLFACVPLCEDAA